MARKHWSKAENHAFEKGEFMSEEVLTSVKTDLPIKLHARLRMEAVRRRVQGQPCTLAGIVLEAIEAAAKDWPELPIEINRKGN
jgi:hypothetical protein